MIKPKLSILILVEVILVVFLIILTRLNTQFFSDDMDFYQAKLITIEPGTSISKAGQILADSAIISSRTDFLDFVRYYRRGQDIKFGIYQFKKPVSLARAFDVLHSGKAKLKKITFPEGIRIRDFAGILQERFGYDSTLISKTAMICRIQKYLFCFFRKQQLPFSQEKQPNFSHRLMDPLNMFPVIKSLPYWPPEYQGILLNQDHMLFLILKWNRSQIFLAKFRQNL